MASDTKTTEKHMTSQDLRSIDDAVNELQHVMLLLSDEERITFADRSDVAQIVKEMAAARERLVAVARTEREKRQSLRNQIADFLVGALSPLAAKMPPGDSVFIYVKPNIDITMDRTAGASRRERDVSQPSFGRSPNLVGGDIGDDVPF